MPEALACGTPVLALRRGSAPEVLREGVTGFIRDTEDALVEAVTRIAEIDRARCRTEAEWRFSPTVMATAYEQVYARAIQQSTTATPLGARPGSDGLAVIPRSVPPLLGLSKEADRAVTSQSSTALNREAKLPAATIPDTSGKQDGTAWAV